MTSGSRAGLACIEDRDVFTGVEAGRVDFVTTGATCPGIGSDVDSSNVVTELGPRIEGCHVGELNVNRAVNVLALEGHGEITLQASIVRAAIVTAGAAGALVIEVVRNRRIVTSITADRGAVGRVTVSTGIAIRILRQAR